MKRDRAGRQTEGLLRRITGESETTDALGRVARELPRRQRDLGARRRRQRAAARAQENPRRGVRPSRGAGATSARP